MTWQRFLILLAAIGLVASSLQGVASAHPGHEPLDESADGTTVRGLDESAAADQARPAARHHTPSAGALAAGVVALLASFPNRRRTVALLLALLLALVAFEGAAHAALHLGHVPHANGLAIGASAVLQALADLDGAVPIATPLAPLEPALQRDVAFVADIAVTARQGRAPPPLPA